jgi:hypothetical protein
MTNNDDRQPTISAATTAVQAPSASGPLAHRGTLGEHADLPAVLDLQAAAKMLGVGRTTAYRLVHDDQWPTPVLRLGRLIKIPTRPLLELLAGTWTPPDVAASVSGGMTALGARGVRGA